MTRYLNAPGGSRLSKEKDKIVIEVKEQLSRWWDSLPDIWQKQPVPTTNTDPQAIYGHPGHPDSIWGFHHNIFLNYHTARILSHRLENGKFNQESLESAYAIVCTTELLPTIGNISKKQSNKPSSEANRNNLQKPQLQSSSTSGTESDSEMDEDEHNNDNSDGDGEEIMPFVYLENMVVYCVLSAAGVFLDKISNEYQQTMKSRNDAGKSAPVYLSTLEGAQGFKRSLQAFDRLQIISTLPLYYRVLVTECLTKMPNLIIDVSGIRDDENHTKFKRQIEGKLNPEPNCDEEIKTPRVGPRGKFGLKSVLVITNEELLNHNNDENEVMRE
ncbi:hypothetical protein HK096_001492, partial [Nowakowskiella sp. JEL0078]